MKKLSSYIMVAALSTTLLASPSFVFAATVTTTTTMEKKAPATPGAMQKTDATEVTTTTKVEYELPYPGLLPDNPLYALKQFRDWLLDKLIVDPVKKAEFYILQGDKRLSMGILLAAKGNSALSEQIISKGEKYMSNAVDALLSLKSQGKDVPAYIVDHLTKALAKHVEVLQEQVAKAADSQKAALTGSLELAKKLQEKLSQLK